MVPNLGEIARAEYKELFTLAVTRGTREPLVLPFCILGPFILPPLYLAVPHRNRPWLYHARWLVIAFVVTFNLYIILRMSSFNVGPAYGAGLIGSWGVLLNLNLLVWTNPQTDYARIIRVPKKLNGTAENHAIEPSSKTQENRVRHRKPHASANAPLGDVGSRAKRDDLEDTVCVWQRFPENGSLGQRLNWTFDLMTNFREIGWNCSISSVPRPSIPDSLGDGDLVSFDNMPAMSRSGYYRHLTEKEFLWTRVRNVLLLAVVLDFGSVIMVKDPYCVYGPGHNLELPIHLQQLHPRLLRLYRELASLLGIYAAIDAMFTLHDLFQYYVFSYFYPMRGELWQYSNIFGPISQVLDRGLAGWWGAFWHQTFRLQFVAPAKFLVNNGYLEKKTLLAQIVTLYISFIQSGILHGAGSVSSMRTTKPWRAPVFFSLQPPGIIAQLFLLQALDKYFPDTPKKLRQIFNLLFTLSWLHLTAPFFTDDVASTGLWVLEPVPVSLLRWLGFGHPDDHWWRWNRDMLPAWHSDEYWWKSGLKL
ncbi:hypothetical protein F66182_1341 [Fusarium sp. NRRL 66182]|nr:hypothetical protein F66182_1341 [Fusarium sp. NRRL 66182]